MNKCCGTCKWLAKEPWEYRDCLWKGPLPDSNADARELMKESDGENCPCYEVRSE